MFTKLIVRKLIDDRNLKGLREVLAELAPPEVAELVEELDEEDATVAFRLLPRHLAAEAFEALHSDRQQQLIRAFGNETDRLAGLLNDLSPDDRTQFFEELPGPVTQQLLSLLSPNERRIAVRLLGYPEESIGRLMTPEYVAVRPSWTMEEVLAHIRRYGHDSETLSRVYVVDDKGHLTDDLRLREILLSPPQVRVEDIMDGRFATLTATDDQETAVEAFRTHGYFALPVTDSDGMLLGIVTADDVLDVAHEEASEDIQMIGGAAALDEPYKNAAIRTLIRKRAPWLVTLLFGEMLTATAMSYYEAQLAHLVVLAFFLPLIISSGGNSGSQATTLIIRSLAVGELVKEDWLRVAYRESISGLALGLILGIIGFGRVVLWEQVFGTYGEHALLIATTVGVTLTGIVLLGTLFGSMLPFLVKRIGIDPAVSSAPLVATLIDVTGIVMYFSAAALILGKVLR
ncbi:MAG: magnesium transporter [Candidatus Schekmanbacteria bacterium]|nr:magnesium transporter [Candidatus Schekmanbacteria bacterium]